MPQPSHSNPDPPPPLLSYQGPKFLNARGAPRHWAEDHLLVLEKGADLPPFCVLCDADAPHPHPAHTVRWSGDAACDDNPVIVFFGALATTRMPVKLGLCPTHRAARRRAFIIKLTAVVLAIAALAAALVLLRVDEAGLYAAAIFGAIAATAAALKLASSLAILSTTESPSSPAPAPSS